MSTHDEQMAAMTKWLNEHPCHPRPYDTIAEERMAHVANGGTLRPVPVSHSLGHVWRRDLRDEVGYVADGFGSWRWEPVDE